MSAAPPILVTGGAGYVGSHVCKALAGAGFLPVSADNLSRGHAVLAKWGPLEIGDIRDRNWLGDVFSRHAPVAVIHMAALAEAGESEDRPQDYYDVNVNGTLALAAEAVAAGVDKVVYSSTCAIYGTPRANPIQEDARAAPMSPYGASKAAAERLLLDVLAPAGGRRVALRYFNAAGADPEGDTGERHDPETHLIPNAVRTALGLREYIDIYGTDFPTPDGTAIRDYIHVADLATAHVAALRSLLDGGRGGIFNIGTGTGSSVRDVIAAVVAASGAPVEARLCPRRAVDPPELVADPIAFQEAFGLRPEMSDLDTIVATALVWHRKEAGLSND